MESLLSCILCEEMFTFIYMKACFKYFVRKNTLRKQINCASNVDFIKLGFPTEVDFKCNCRGFFSWY